MHTEISRDLLDRDAVISIACDPNNVVTELTGIRPGHNDILPAHPTGASQLRCHLFVQQTLSEHWEQIADRKSRGRFKELRPDERPGSVRYGLHRIEVGGGLVSHDVVQWAQKVDSAVREQASAAGQKLLKPEDSVEHLFYDDPPNL
jgi:hypothetical protein